MKANCVACLPFALLLGTVQVSRVHDPVLAFGVDHCRVSAPTYSDDCTGCALTWVTYLHFWMGTSQPIPNLTVDGFTPGWGSNNGDCVGTKPNCEWMPCKFGKGILNMTVAAGATIEFNNAVTGAHIATVTAGDGGATVEITVYSESGASGNDPINVGCGSIHDVLTLGGGETIALHCTACT